LSGEQPVGAGGGRPRAASLAGLGPTLVFGFAAHLAVAVISVVVVPVYLLLMGNDAYGLVTLYLVLQAWMLMFDLGVSPAVARQLSRFRAGALESGEAAGLLRVAEIVFIGGGVVAGGIFLLASPWIAGHWLGRSSLAPGVVATCLRLVALLLVFRWLTGLYQAALIGLERQNPVNAIALVAALARNGATVAVLLALTRSPVMFFAVQAAFTVAEAIACRLLLATAAPRAGGAARGGWRLLQGEFRFAAGITIAATVATAINQADKLALSHVLPLGEFGVFGLVVSICGGIAMVVPPFVQAFQPRLTTLLAQGRRAEFVHVYHLSAAVILALAAGLAGTIAARPEWVIYVWTGGRALGERLAPVLAFYAAGSGVAAFLFVPFLLQYAQGQVRLHVIGYSSFAVVWIPAAVWAALAHGPLATGMVWLGGNLAYLAIWVPVIHRRLLSPEERRGLDAGVWLTGGILAAVLAASRLIDLGDASRAATLAALAAISLTVTALGIALSKELRAWAADSLARFAPARR
jgi:O-antigen/teichoic acid export membrane protein